MSSTKRGSDRNVSDYYVTPQWAVQEFLERFIELEPTALEGTILDPCAGGSAAHEPTYPVVLMKAGVREDLITTIDLREDSRAAVKGDYLAADKVTPVDLIISNPPFFLAQEFITKGLSEVRDGGFVVMLLRLNFFGSQKRLPFWNSNMAKHAFVHSKRMSFANTAKAKTDSIEYMHCVWQKGHRPSHTMLHII